MERFLGPPGPPRPPKTSFSNLATMWGDPPLLPTCAKRSKSGSFGDDPTSTCYKTIKICKKRKENCQNLQNQTSTCLKTGGPLRGPEGPGGPSRPLPGPSGAPPGPPVFLVQSALQDEPRRSRGVLGPSLAENRPKTKNERTTWGGNPSWSILSVQDRNKPLTDRPSPSNNGGGNYCRVLFGR